MEVTTVLVQLLKRHHNRLLCLRARASGSNNNCLLNVFQPRPPPVLHAVFWELITATSLLARQPSLECPHFPSNLP